MASAKIIPIHPVGCLHKPSRLSDSLRAMTDSSFSLFKENWIHQLLVNDRVRAFEHTPSKALGVCGVFKGVFAHMYTLGSAGTF